MLIYGFDLGDSFDPKIQEDFEDLQKHTSVSLHVRRTDYTGIQHILPCQTIEYYTNAVKEIGHYDYLLIFRHGVFQLISSR